jgi:methyl-accepting chemotaxis protein
MSHLSLGQRLAFINAALILPLCVTAIAVWTMMGGVISQTRSIGQDNVPQLSAIGEIELNVTMVSLQLRHAILSRNEQELATTLADITSRKARLYGLLDNFGKGMADDAGRSAFEPLPALMDEFWRVGERNLALITAGQRAEAFAFLVDETVPARNRLLAPLEAEKQRQTVGLASAVDEVVELSTQDRLLVVAAVLIVTSGLLGLAWYLRRVVAQLGGDPDDLVKAADSVANGDLETRLTLRPGDTHSVMFALHRMTDQLNESVSTVRQGAEQVANASAEIASGNNDLSMRTEQQASALEQTASSMEELGATITSNADNSTDASRIASEASALAVKGQQAVGNVVTTMQAITDSSAQINEITGTIDSLAFQTNILALNAAVEAARAGEQGRGFAVVAGEVRSLAQRSAEAARQIRTLIDNSSQRVAQGSQLVGQAGHAMSDIVSAIQRVSALVQRISEAGQEQSSGVRQVAEAVSHMDQATQQNAALVEEMAAAAQGLQRQARDLLEAVSQFKTRARERGGASALPRIGS